MFPGSLYAALLLLAAPLHGLIIIQDGKDCACVGLGCQIDHTLAFNDDYSLVCNNNFTQAASFSEKTNQNDPLPEFVFHDKLAVLQDSLSKELSRKSVKGGHFATKIAKQFDPFSILYDALPPPFQNFLGGGGGGGTQVVCDNPGPIQNGLVSDTSPSFSPGSVIDFSCQDGFHLMGASRLTCLLSGKWSDEVPKCTEELACPDVEVPVAAHVNYIPPLHNEEHMRRATILPVLEGISMPDHLIDIVTAAPNEEAPEAAEEDHLPSGYRKVGTRAVYNCISEFYSLEGSKTRICMPDGKWTGRQTTCVPKCGMHSSVTANSDSENSTSAAKWPWQAALATWIPPKNEWIITCGGVLIREDWVMTAAHCVSQEGTTPFDTNVVFVYLGKYYRDDDKDDQTVQYRSPQKIFIHPDFDPVSFDNDIALIWLSKPVELSDRVQPVCLPSKHTTDKNIRRGKFGVIPGWGISNDGNFLKELHQITLPVVLPNECEQTYLQQGHPLLVTERMYCAGFDDGRRDACAGDSGGPMLFLDPHYNKWVVEGLVSWGSPEGCAVPKHYGGYTKVYSFLNWIHLFI